MLAFLLTETAHLSVPQLKSRVARSCWQQTRTHHVSAVQRAVCISAAGTHLFSLVEKALSFIRFAAESCAALQLLAVHEII